MQVAWLWFDMWICDKRYQCAMMLSEYDLFPFYWFFNLDEGSEDELTDSEDELDEDSEDELTEDIFMASSWHMTTHMTTEAS